MVDDGGWLMMAKQWVIIVNYWWINDWLMIGQSRLLIVMMVDVLDMFDHNLSLIFLLSHYSNCLTLVIIPIINRHNPIHGYAYPT